jgi:hypothetical protein
MQSNGATSAGSKRMRAQVSVAAVDAAAAGASIASFASGVAASADASTSPLSISDAATAAAKRQRRADEQTKEFRARVSSEDGRMEDEEEKEKRKSVASDNDDGDSEAVAAAAAIPILPSCTTDHGASSKDVLQEHSDVIGSICRIDLDSLSITLSMLSSDDFLSAIRTNKQFYAARLKKSAWPTFQLDSFIQSLRDDDYDNPARRRLRLRIPSKISADGGLSLPANAAPVFGSGASSPSAWRFVADVQLYNENKRLNQSSVDVLLPGLARLPCLTAVNFHLVNVSAAAFEHFCSTVAPRLQVLLFERVFVRDVVDPLTHIGLLHELRVLVVDEFPPMAVLLQLHRLEYLHVALPPNGSPASLYATALRHLSCSYALRSLSFGEDFDEALAFLRLLEGLLAMTPPAKLRAAHAALVDWRQPIQLTDLSLASDIADTVLQKCATIPTLTRLQADVYMFLPHGSVFTQLRQLNLQLYDGTSLLELAQCNQLRALQLCFREADEVSADTLCAIVASNAASLEELCVRCLSSQHSLASALEDGAEGADKWNVIST